MARNFVLGMVVGAAVGAAVGFAYAPRPGSRTREDLTVRGRDAAARFRQSTSGVLRRRSEKEEPVQQSI